LVHLLEGQDSRYFLVLLVLEISSSVVLYVLK
jgi:hypothetical protein